MPALSETKRALLERLLNGEAGRSSARIPRRPPGAETPLSFGQRQIWLHQQLAPETPVYNEALTLRREGPLDADALSRALAEFLRRHEAWRTSFPLVDDRPVQRVEPPTDVRLVPLDLSGPGGEERALALATEDARRPFDLAAGPPLRYRLFTLGPRDHRLSLTLHHILFDGVSIYRVFLPELIALYEAFARGEPSPLPEPELQYPDVAVWEAETLTPERTAGDVAWFRERLAGAPALGLPFDRARPPVQTFRGAMRTLALSPELTEGLRELARRERTTLYVTLLAAFAALLERLTWQEDVVLGSVTSGRERVETESVVGYFLRTVPLRLDLAGAPPFTSLLARVKDAVLGVLAHDAVPFERLVGELARRRDPSRNPFFTVLFSLEPPIAPLPPGWTFTQMDVSVGTAKFDLALELDERPEGLIGRFLYATDLFGAESVERIARAFLTLLPEIVKDPRRPVAELPITEPEESQALVMRARASLAPRSSETLASLVVNRLEGFGDAAAVKDGSETLTYRELHARVERAASALAARGLGRGARVAVLLPRSSDAVVTLAAIAKAGAAFVPLEAEQPDARLAALLERSGAAAVVTSRALAGRIASPVPVLLFEELRGGRGEVALEPPSPDDPAYVLFTSGSTGVPKGVVVPHGAIAHHLAARARVAPLKSDDVFLHKASLAFDISVWEVFGTLLAGARLVVASPETARDAAALASLAASEGVTAAHFAPPALRVLLDTPAVSRWRPRRLYSGGEPLEAELAERVFEVLPYVELYSQYGPTETTVDVTLGEVRRRFRSRAAPLGAPLPGIALHLLDARGAPVPDGFPGEIAVAGPTLARGYLDDPAATAAAFVRDPFSDEEGARLYRTGDLARVDADGELEFLGRLDGQVKVRGQRVELGEIESALAAHPLVLEAAAVLREDGPEGALVGYVVTKPGHDVAPEELAAYLRARLPSAMVPARWSFAAALPRLPSGKLDRRALPAPAEARGGHQAYEAPRTDMERLLAEICASVLRVPRVGVHDNLFEIGADSLSVQVIANRAARAGIGFPVSRLLACQTIDALAASREGEADAPSLSAARAKADAVRRGAGRRDPVRSD